MPCVLSRRWSIPYPEGKRFGDYQLRESTFVAFENTGNCVVITLLGPDVSESGATEEDAFENLSWFISELLDEMQRDSRPLGRRLGQQIESLKKIFERVNPDH